MHYRYARLVCILQTVLSINTRLRICILHQARPAETHAAATVQTALAASDKESCASRARQRTTRNEVRIDAATIGLMRVTLMWPSSNRVSKGSMTRRSQLNLARACIIFGARTMSAGFSSIGFSRRIFAEPYCFANALPVAIPYANANSCWNWSSG